MNLYFFNKDIEKFIKSLGKQTIAKILRTIDLLERFGCNLGLPHSKKISKKLFELRIHGVQEIRIFYVFYKNSVVLLHIFKKKTQKLSQKEIKIALQRFKKLDNI